MIPNIIINFVEYIGFIDVFVSNKLLSQNTSYGTHNDTPNMHILYPKDSFISFLIFKVESSYPKVEV